MNTIESLHNDEED